MNLNCIGKSAKIASISLAKLSTDEKNNLLKVCAEMLLKNKNEIIEANKLDIQNATMNNTKKSMIERLFLDEKRIEDMSLGILKVVDLSDPIGEDIYVNTLENGLKIYKRSVAMGVIGIIYEARPNVTSDSFAICVKSSSAIILKGGKEALNSNRAIVKALKEGIKSFGYDENIVQMIDDTNRETTLKMMKMKEYIDLLIPRGGIGLIKTVVENSTIPVIETGIGNCHIFVDEFADIEKAIPIILNSKTQRTSVCNALETLLVHKNISNEFLPKIIKCLKEYNVEIRGCENVKAFDNSIILACEDDWKNEFLDYILAIKIVDSLDDAIEHIYKYSTKHSEVIITENKENAEKFTTQIDAAVVYVNASTRFTDGEQFGFGAEIGISTQKLHARGPMGLKEITSYKYIVLGNGQIRE